MRNSGPTRRSFLCGLTALPALGSRALAEEISPSQEFHREPRPITAADQVLNVMDFEPLARNALPPAHFAYMATGIDDDRTVIRNHEAFSHYEIRARRFSELTHMDLTRSVYGTRWTSPLYLSAVSSMRAFHPEAETAVARAARSRSTPMMLSTGSTTPVETVTGLLGHAPWQQLYPTDDWAVTTALVRRAEAAGCAAIALTVDSRGERNNETLKRAMLTDNRDCQGCHIDNRHDMWLKAPYFSGLDVARVTTIAPLDMPPAYLDRMRKLVKGRLIIKGVVTAEDAALVIEHGADGIVVSNHGGRNEETLRATVDCVPEVVAAAKGRVPVFLDGGIRRGTDIFKALALGVTAVGIGRPQVWGLAAFGQPGVEAVIDILNRELAAIMRQAGTTAVDQITAANVIRSMAG